MVQDIQQKLIDLVNQHYNPNKKFIINVEKPKTDDIVDFWADISKIKKEFNWEAKTSIEEGVEKTINYFENREANWN